MATDAIDRSLKTGAEGTITLQEWKRARASEQAKVHVVQPERPGPRSTGGT